jgi:hypothetical protein
MIGLIVTNLKMDDRPNNDKTIKGMICLIVTKL